MPNPLGRPRGKGPGKYTMSAKAYSARRSVAALARPGALTATPEDKARAYKIAELGRAATLEVTEQFNEYLKANRLACKRFVEVIGDPWSSPEKIAAIADARIKPHELKSMFESAHNRWGTPQRTIQDVTMRDVVPDYLAASRETADWDSPPEDDHAEPATNGHAGNGSAH
mgnify:CR=1 FL=1